MQTTQNNFNNTKELQKKTFNIYKKTLNKLQTKLQQSAKTSSTNYKNAQKNYKLQTTKLKCKLQTTNCKRQVHMCLRYQKYLQKLSWPSHSRDELNFVNTQFCELGRELSHRSHHNYCMFDVLLRSRFTCSRDIANTQ